MSNNENIILQNAQPSAYKDGAGGAALYPSAVLGIVKKNYDPTRSGRIYVYLKKGNTPVTDDPNSWVPVRYMSPFFGYTPNTGSPDSYGDFEGNPNSYGFWATPPDLETEVICIFLNGDPNYGYYIGGVPKAGLNHMVPAIGSADYIIPNDAEAAAYGGATRLPVTEINNANQKQENNPNLTNQARPVHTYQAAILNNQGLLRDPDRGSIGSSATRESPSRVFGISTPGRPIYTGGYDDKTIKDAASNSTTADKNFKVTGRRGGHTLVMDDGDINGKDQLIRLRTSTGHQILMNDSAETLFIIHANGQSYIELGKEGTIDMYSTNSVNIRTQGDLNLHADKDVNIFAANNFNVSANNISMEAENSVTQYAGMEHVTYAKGDITSKADGMISMKAASDASLASGGTTFINGGPDVKLNTGSISLDPPQVDKLTIIKHPDTLKDKKTGYASADDALGSIVTRAPAHSPWKNANKGVDVEVDLAAENNLPTAPSALVTATNTAANDSPTSLTSSALTSTIPAVPAISNQLDSVTSTALVGQMAANAGAAAGADAVAGGGAILSDIAGNKTAVVGALALTPTQLSQAGIIKPGADTMINAMVQGGSTLKEALTPAVFTGQNGIKNLTQLTNSQSAQISAASNLLGQGEKALQTAGLIGKESASQTGGFILAAATAGPAAVLDFAKNAASNAGTKAFGAINSLVGGAQTIMNKTMGSVSSLISGGKFSANLADKALSGFSVGGLVEQGRGMAAAAFAKATETFAPLKGKVPQHLPSVTDLASDTASTVKSALALPNVADIQKSIGAVAGSATGALDTIGTSISEVSSKITSSGGIQSLVTSAMDVNTSDTFNKAVSSFGSGGPVDIKSVFTRTQSFDMTGAVAQSEEMLGSTRLPPVFSSVDRSAPVVDTAQTQRETTNNAAQAQETYMAKGEVYKSIAAELGKDNPKAIAAYDEYKAAGQAASKYI